MENQNAPTIKTNKGVKFFNPGDRISETIPYSIDGADIHCIAHYEMNIEERGFTWVPTEIRFNDTQQRIAVDFPTTVCLKFKQRGVVMIDEEHTPDPNEEEEDKIPIAATEDAAREKGERIWRSYLFEIVRRHKTLCGEIRAKGGIPEEARGFTRRALKLLNMRDPALEFMAEIQHTESLSAPAKTSADGARISSLEAQIEATNGLVQQLLAKLAAKEDIEQNEKIEKRTSRASRSNKSDT